MYEYYLQKRYFLLKKFLLAFGSFNKSIDYARNFIINVLQTSQTPVGASILTLTSSNEAVSLPISLIWKAPSTGFKDHVQDSSRNNLIQTILVSG